jgi:hypothetical protein
VQFSPSSRTACFLIVAIGAFAIAPYLFVGYANGHDLGFHVTSWLEISRHWHQGIVYPRWAEWAYGQIYGHLGVPEMGSVRLSPFLMNAFPPCSPHQFQGAEVSKSYCRRDDHHEPKS